MGTIAQLTATDNMASSKKPFLTDIREHTGSIVDYINDKITDNFNAIAQDAFPSGYAFDNDGVKQFSASVDLFQKQRAEASYTGGDITIAATGAWTDVDASNAKITFTPSYLAGDFRVGFQFSLNILTSNATNEAHVRFRLTDGSTTSTRIAQCRFVSGVSGTRNVLPINLYHHYTSLAASAQTIKLQYFLVTSTATTVIVEANTNSPLVATTEKI